MEDRIEAAAVSYNGKVYRAKSHFAAMTQVYQEHPDAFIPQNIQGFVTSSGVFVSRYDAAKIAFRAGQTKTLKERLLSEHLWP